MSSISALFLPPLDEYDAQLAREGEDICRVLNLPTHVRRITWIDRVLRHTFDSDSCGFVREEGCFPAQMRGKLEPRELRPIMASSRIYRRIRGNPPLRNIFVEIFTLFILLLTIAGVSAGVVPGGGDLALALVIMISDGLLLVSSFAKGTKKLKLQADLLAARVEGRQEFLSVLRKIQSLGLSDVVKTERRGIRRYFSGKPSIQERVANVSSNNQEI